MSFRPDDGRRPRTRTAGYTLIELMIVVMIIGMSLLAFAPGFGRAMADREVSTAARELIRIGRRARSESYGYLRAHLVWIDPGKGIVQLLRAPTNSCTLTKTWSTIQLDCTARKGPCLESFNLARWGSRTISMYEDVDGSYGQSPRALCYAPNGSVLHAQVADLATVATSLIENNTVQGGFVYVLLSGTTAPTATDRVHRLLFPLGGGARSLR